MSSPAVNKRHFPEIDKKNCVALVDFFLKHEDSEMFRDAVDWESLGLESYPKIIKKPMDLSSVKRNLGKFQYRSKEDFASDMKLIWSNAIEYNEDGSDINKQAGKYTKLFDELFQKMVVDPSGTFLPQATTINTSSNGNPARRQASFSNDKDGVDTSTHPSKDDMEMFSELIQKLNSIDRGRVVLLIDELCRQCLVKPEHNELEIQVDAMEKTTFRHLVDFMETCIVDEKKRKKGKRKRPSEVGAGADL